MLTDIIREATYNDEIVIGNPKVITSKEFLSYPVAWSKNMERMTGLYIEQDILPAYLRLVMHTKTTIFKRKLVSRGIKPIGQLNENETDLKHSS